MTAPAAAARRQHTLDALAAALTDWGCPEPYAADRARHLLDVVTDHGYALPAALTDTPAPRGGGSTRRGRLHAARVFEQTRAGCRCPALGLVSPELHAGGCPIRSRAASGTEPAQEPRNPPPPPDHPTRHLSSRDESPQQEDACRWAHGPVDVLDDRGLCPVCAADE